MSKSSLLLAYGNQQLILDERVEQFIQSALKGRERADCVERFDLAELCKGSGDLVTEQISDFLLSCETLPFLSDRKIIRIDHVELLKVENKKKTKTTSAVAWLFQSVSRILQNPPAAIWFVLTSPSIREQDFSKPLLRILKEKGTIAKFVAYDDHSPIQWVTHRCVQKELHLSPAVIQLLIEIIGNDLTDLEQELEKLSLLFGKGSSLTEEQLLCHSQGHKHFQVFRIAESLMSKNLAQTLEILDRQLRENPREQTKLFGILLSQFQRLLLIHYYWKSRLPEKTILNTLKLHPYIGKQLFKQARKFTLPELEAILLQLAKLDLVIKFNSNCARPLFQDFFQQICAGAFKQHI